MDATTEYLEMHSKNIEVAVIEMAIDHALEIREFDSIPELRAKQLRLLDDTAAKRKTR